MVEGRYYTSGAASYSFNLVPVPRSATIVLSGLGESQGPDLAVRNLVVTSVGDDLISGGQVTLTWDAVNIGTAAVTTGWEDRILVRNLSTGDIIGSYILQQNEASWVPLESGQTVSRQITLTLPEGNRGAGDISFQITTDISNVIEESGSGGAAEFNNSASVTLFSLLANYADLQVSNLRVEPASAWAPGEAVTVYWLVNNTGNDPVTTAWNDRLSIRNTSNGQVLTNLDLQYDPQQDGVLDVDGFVERAYTFIWPQGALATGQFEFSIAVDSSDAIFENNSADTAEINNFATMTGESGPDLVVKNITITNEVIQAGDLLAITWEDWNEGAAPVPTGFNDRVQIINTSTGQTLLNTTVAYQPSAGEGLIGAGEFRQRSLNFRLPDGAAGAGDIKVIVTSAYTKSFFEFNQYGDAAYNNAETFFSYSAARPYADITIPSLTVPASGYSGEPITISWTGINNGAAPSASAWNDQIILSTSEAGANAVVIGTVRHTGVVEAGATYTQTATIRLPFKPQGAYFITVVADSGNEVLEPDTRGNNNSAAAAIGIVTPFTDLVVSDVTVPDNALSGESIQVSWVVHNTGTGTTDLALWNDRVVLSRDGTVSSDDIILSGSVSHAGFLSPGQSYTGRATVTLPRDISGDYYLIVDTNTNRTVSEGGRVANNILPSTVVLHIGLAPTADLIVGDVTGPTDVRPGDEVTVNYVVNNAGGVAATAAWRDRIYLETEAGALVQVANFFNTAPIAAGDSESRSVTFTLPTSFVEGSYRWLVVTDTDNTIFERNDENNNRAYADAAVRVARPDLSVVAVTGPAVVQSGTALLIEWTVANIGGVANGGWKDQVFLVKGSQSIKVGEVVHAAALASNDSYSASLSIDIPLAYSGEYQVVVITDSGSSLLEHTRSNNQISKTFTIDLAPYADLAVSAVTAPAQVIADPAALDVAWTVTNNGTGAGSTHQWTDRLILSRDSILGNGDDLIIGEFLHDGALAAGAAYSRNERILLPIATTGHFTFFVVSDAKSVVFENYAESNNAAQADHFVDVMAVPYADLQVQSTSVTGDAVSGSSVRVSWDVINNGIGITNAASWSDSVWLSRNPSGSDRVGEVIRAGHIGQLAVGDAYTRSIDLQIPNGLQGTFYVNVSTGGPFEFIHTDNNKATSVPLTVTLASSPDLVVAAITLPETAQEGGLLDIAWTVVNQGAARAAGSWIDTVVLEPVSGGSAITLGSFTYDRGLEAGVQYVRAEQLRLPSRIEGLYRVKVITNANLGATGSQVYEYGDARNNNALLSSGATTIQLNDRPDLRVTAASTVDHVTAGGQVSVSYTVSNQGPTAANGHWKDRVYLSLDGTLSADDQLLGSFDNAGALAPSESYSAESALVDIPLRYRGNAYLIVVADGTSKVDEYPNEANNVRAVQFYVDPVPFADLVTSNVVAPDQAVHGSSIEVRYKVTNSGSDTTRGESATLSSWTDTIWLARDKTRPGAYKGDVLLGTVTHNGKLEVGQDYLGITNVTIPDWATSGNYYITVWSDAYDVILEDTLASNINLDDPVQTDNNNYKARSISIIGAIAPDLVVTQVSAPVAADAGQNYSFSYVVKNNGESFSGSWTDSVYITDDPDLAKAKSVWFLGSYQQQRSLGSGEQYTVSQTVALAPSINGRYIVVRTDAAEFERTSASRGLVAESDDSNNTKSSASVVTPHAADLQVTAITTLPSNYSGEETTISWTVTNFGEAVWAGTSGWVDSVYISRDPEFIPSRATALGALAHSNIGGLASGASYTATGKFKLPVGADGQYYIYVITDSEPKNGDILTAAPSNRAADEYLGNGQQRNQIQRDSYYRVTAYEGALRDNNVSRSALSIEYREPDLQIDSITVSDPNPSSGQQITVSWTVSNRGTRDTRTVNWLDGIYLSRDASLDSADYPLVDRGSEIELLTRVRSTVIKDGEGIATYLRPGESYTNSATFSLPESISGNFNIIVKADTSTVRDRGNTEPSGIRDGLFVLGGTGAGSVLEFANEGNNVASIALPISLATPPDLRVSAVTTPATVIAGQSFTVDFSVTNAGGNTPVQQGNWNDLIFLSKDRFLDVSKDRYIGYVGHAGGLAGGASYNGQLSITAPRDLEGSYYVFVVTDPANIWGNGSFGQVREFSNDMNNATAAAQPMIIETPPPADLKVQSVNLPAQAQVGDSLQISYSISNDSINPAYGRWTDAIYLSSDNSWDIGDILLGKVEHIGDLAANGSYNGTLTAKLPPLKDGNWRIIVRPDLYNEVFEGKIVYSSTGLNLPPGEANNRQASGSTLTVQVPVLSVGTPLSTTLSEGETRLYRVSVASGETLRVGLDSSADTGANEIFIRYGDIPTGYVYDAAYSNAFAPDQQAVIPSTQAGDYYVLVRSRQGHVATPVTLRADLLPLSISRITPDQGGVGDAEHRWVTVDIYGSHFKAGALVKLSRPGVSEVEPDRWQVLDATHIRAIFDTSKLPYGLYDVTVINPDGQRVTEASRYLIERGIEADVTIGIGGPRSINPGENATYSVSLQSLTNVDTPYVRFDIGVPNMGYSQNVLEGLNLPYVVFASNVGGSPTGATTDTAGNTQDYGQTPTTGTSRSDIPWAQLDGAQNTAGINLAPGYAFDVAANGFVGMNFNVQTYPGLQEWINYDFEGLREKLYQVRPEWRAQGFLDGGVQDLNKIQEGLTKRFLSREADVHLSELEALAMPFRFNVLGAATPLKRDEFIADQTEYAKKLRNAILADTAAPASLSVLAADEAQWVKGWLSALESAGILRPEDEAPPIRDNPMVLSLNATLASGILLAKGGESYRTQADILGFFAQVQKWYGDTARYAGDPQAAVGEFEYYESRDTSKGETVEIPVPEMANIEDYVRNAAQDTHFLNFNVFAGSNTELEYLRHIGLLDSEFRPVGPQALNLAQYLQQIAHQNAEAQAIASVRGPQAALAADGNSYVPAGVALPYTLSFSNPTESAAGQIRLVTQLDANLDPRSLRLGDLKIGDINVHVPTGLANFQGDFDFSGSKGFILRVSAGIEIESRTATWLLQAIDPDTGEVLQDATRGLLAPAAGKTDATLTQGYVSYSVSAAANAVSGSSITAQVRVLIDAAPPVDSTVVSNKLDARAPATTVTVTSLGNDNSGAPVFDVQWQAIDELSGVKSVTVYVAEDGGDFRIWLRQVDAGQTQSLFTGEAGKHYEFLAVAIDNAGNREAASVANAVLPDDGSRQAVLDGLGSNETLTQTVEIPLATADRTYSSNALFQQSTQQLPGPVASANPGDLQAVLAPFSLRGFADGFSGGASDIGALAMVELADHTVLVSAGALRNEVFRYGKDGGRSTTPLFTLDAPVLDMAVDSYGQLWVMTGSELLQVDISSGAVVRRMSGPGQEPLTHALAIHPVTGEIYVSSGNGIEVFRPNETVAGKAWQHFSSQRVSDMAFGPDGRLWAVRWTGSDILSAQTNPATEILSFPMSGSLKGRAELEYRLAGLIDSIAFGATGTPLEGLLLASSNLKQRPVIAGSGSTPHQSAVWMIELQSRQLLQLASGGTQGESIVATRDGRILVAQTGHVDEIAPIHAPHVTAVSVPDGSLLPLPVGQIAVSFDQAMWLGTEADTDISSVLHPQNFTLTVLGNDAGAVITPKSVRWDAATRTAYLDVSGLQAGSYQLGISSTLRSATEVRMDQGYVSVFTAVLDMSSQIRLDFSNTRANHATGEVSYDISLTNIGTDALRGPLTLLLDPGRYFSGNVQGANAGTDDQSDLWILDLSAALAQQGGRFAVGATISNQTITVVPASLFGTQAGSAELVKFNLGHGVYALPQENLPPELGIYTITAGNAEEGEGDEEISIDSDIFETATAGQPWTGQLAAVDADGTLFYWELVQAPAGMTLTPPTSYGTAEDVYYAVATLSWTPTARSLANTEVVVRVQDSRGGVATKRFVVPVTGGNFAPVIDAVSDITLEEGQVLSLPLTAADANGDRLTVTVRNLPAGASFNAATGMLTWTPGYDQAGVYENVTVVVSDGKATVSSSFNITVDQGYAKPVLRIGGTQTLREGEAFGLQLAGSMPGGLQQADGTRISLSYSAPWLPGGATLNSETGWLSWTPDFNQHGLLRVPVTLTASYSTPDGELITTEVTQELVLNVLNANGAPVFDTPETWNVLEGQPLRISVFAFDPDNPDFEPKIRLTPTSPATGPETTASTVSYQVSGLPAGATFDTETFEIVWTPGYAQAGSYNIVVTATDTGDGTGTPAISQIVLPIVVADANRAPDIGDVSNITMDKGAVLEIPVSAVDVDGNPVQLTVIGLPSFATYTQNPSSAGSASGVIRFAPGAQSRGDYTITVVAQDNGGGNINQLLTQAKSFVLTVKSISEAPVLALPTQLVAVVGQAFSLPISVSDLDQDALSFSANGLPIGATLTAQTSYGQALLSWTPAAGDIGVRDIEIVVTDSGLPPQDAGYPAGTATAANVVRHTVRVIVREANSAPELLGLQANGVQVADSGNAATVIPVNASEGVPLSLELFARDVDADKLSWKVSGLPSGMQLDIPATADGSHAVLNWIPGLFAAQGDNVGGGSAGTYRVTVQATDGSAVFVRTLEIRVANVNQTPVILPMPLQLVNEGETLAFSVRSADPDNDLLSVSLVYDENTPDGVLFDGKTGYFEWTPSRDVVNNATADSKAFALTFRVSDGSLVSTQTVQIRVFDSNHTPTISTVNHALLVGQTLSLPVQLGGVNDGRGIYANDADGSVQTAQLAVSFSGLPEGAVYDSATQQLIWTPGPGQSGDYVVTAHVSDGKYSTFSTFILRVVADAAANKPTILLETTPSTPALPGQTVVATVRGDAWSGIDHLVVEVRGGGLGEQWQTVSLDTAGRMRFVPTQPGLVEMRITAVDRDGFSNTETRTIRVKDPADTQAPVLAWQGALLGATAFSEPVDVSSAISLQAKLQEQQLMGYTLEIALAGTDRWLTLGSEDAAAIAVNGQLNLGQLDPAKLANGVYQLRLRAWDLVGRTTEINSRVIIDSSNKQLDDIRASDASFIIGGHTFALTRVLKDALSVQAADFGNWQLAGLDTRLSTDQSATTASGAIAPWQEGARVWLQIPETLASASATQRYLSFTLDTTVQRLGSEAGAPQVWQPVFLNNDSTAQGWTLQAHSTESDEVIEVLSRQGLRLYDQVTGLPWVPVRYTLTAPDGTRYNLDASGKITAVNFADGVQWLVSDAGIAAVNGDATDRVDFIRDESGRLSRISGDTAEGAASVVYRYDDSQNRLILARMLEANNSGTAYGYDNAGKPFADVVAANLGTAASWLGSNTANQWSGNLSSGQTTTVGFIVRESELASTIKTPGAQGAIIVALEVQLSDAAATVEVTGATVVGSTVVAGKQTLLLRVTEAGLKLIRLNGTGTSAIRVSIAGDLNRDGHIDGTDSALFTSANTGTARDINGDGQIDQTDRQVLFANYGWSANQAPVAGTLPLVKTHTDLAAITVLDAVARDEEGDTVYWRVLGATHGSAKLSSDGKSLIFTPEAGYSGPALIRLQADDGFSSSAPVELSVNVSSAKLIAIHIAPLPALRTGESAVLQATADFEDEKGVVVTNPDWLTLSNIDLAAMGGVGSSSVQIDDNRDLVYAVSSGPALILVTRIDADGKTIRAVAAINPQQADPFIMDDEDSEASYSSLALGLQPDVYPGTVTLQSGGSRQLKVHVLDLEDDTLVRDVHAAQPLAFSGTRYVVSDESIVTVSADGLITAHSQGRATVSIVHLASVLNELGQPVEQVIGQADIVVNVSAVQHVDNDESTSAPSRIMVEKGQSAIISAATGETVQVGEGVLSDAAAIGIERLDLVTLTSTVGMPLPGQGLSRTNSDGSVVPQPDLLQAVGAFRLDIEGAGTAGYPLQLAIPMQLDSSLFISEERAPGAGEDGFVHAGDEVYFLKRGTLLDESGQQKDVWWLIDNGFIGADGVARTASPPNSGVLKPGEYIVSRRIEGNKVIEIRGIRNQVHLDTNTLVAISSIGVAAATQMASGNLGGLMTGISGLATLSLLPTLASGILNTYTYSYEITPTLTITQLPSDTQGTLYIVDTTSYKGPTRNAQGVTAPIIDASSVTFVRDTRSFKFKLQGFDPKSIYDVINPSGLSLDQISSDMMPWAEVRLFADGKLIGKTPMTLESLTGELNIAVPDYYAAGDVKIQVVVGYSLARVVNEEGGTKSTDQILSSNTVGLKPKGSLSITLARDGLTVFRRLEDGSTSVAGNLALDDGLMTEYLMGTKVDGVVMTPDGTRAYVAGKGKIYVVDLLAMKLLPTILLPEDVNVSSLLLNPQGTSLFVATGSAMSKGTYSLMMLDVSPGSGGYHKSWVTLQHEILSSGKNQYGFAGMQISADGKVLIVAAPQSPEKYQADPSAAKGNVYVIDLYNDFNRKSGKVEKVITATINGLTGIRPRSISAMVPGGVSLVPKDKFLVTSVGSQSNGLGALTIKYDANDRPLSASITSIGLIQDQQDIAVERLNIQRAYDAVFFEKDGVQWAIVSDDNNPWSDAYYKAMWEAPNWVYLAPNMPPTAVGGGAAAKSVLVGGKLGLVRDPFGKEPLFVGATTPVAAALTGLPTAGTAFRDLSLNGDVLIVNTWGEYETESGTQFKADNIVFKLSDIMQMTVAHAEMEKNRLKVGIGKKDPKDEQPQETIGQKLLGQVESIWNNITSWVGSSSAEVKPNYTIKNEFSFASAEAKKETTFRAGDVYVFDMAKILFQIADPRNDSDDAKDLRGRADLKSLYELINGKDLAAIRALISEGKISGFNLASESILSLTTPPEGVGESKSYIQLATKNGKPATAITEVGANDKLLSATSVNESYGYDTNGGESNFSDTGNLVMYRYITNEESTALRAGAYLEDVEATIRIGFSVKGGGALTLGFKITNGDVPVARRGEVFFGDRPLDNPGYSELHLSNDIKVGAANDRLDVLKVEQRLKYLGFPALGLSNPNSSPQEFKVDGSWGVDEAAAARYFYKVVTSGPGNRVLEAHTSKAAYWKAIKSAANAFSVDAGGTTLRWLNAYNAPHWMDVYNSVSEIEGVQINDGYNSYAENYGISWVRDLLVAYPYADSRLLNSSFNFNALMDANQTKTPFGHSTHDLGMAFDLGLRPYLADGAFKDVDPNAGGNVAAINSLVLPNVVGAWSKENAVKLLEKLDARYASATKNFLALYDLTRKDVDGVDTGSWESLGAHIKNDVGNSVQVRAALFGDGSKQGGLISSIYIGDAKSKKDPNVRNTMPAVNAVLDRLGVDR